MGGGRRRWKAAVLEAVGVLRERGEGADRELARDDLVHADAEDEDVAHL